jgi:hypothetical protein
MRRIELRITDTRKNLADNIYEECAIEVDGRYSHVKINELTFPMMRQEEKTQYFEIYASWLKAKVLLRLETYLEAFKEERVIPDEADLNNMIWAVKEIISNFIAPLPAQLRSSLDRLGDEQIIADARRDIDLFSQRLSIKEMRAESQKQQPAPGNIYNIHIGENRGPIQQGGERNLQNTNGSDDETQ